MRISTVGGETSGLLASTVRPDQRYTEEPSVLQEGVRHQINGLALYIIFIIYII